MHYHWGDHSSALVKRKGCLVLGVDPLWDDIPSAFRQGSTCDALKSYVDFLISVAVEKVGFVKFQAAFFEAFGSAGLACLAHAIRLARNAGISVILDAKRGDIGSTAAAYARAYLDPGQGSDLEVDCITVNPFLGPETLKPFLECSQRFGKGLFVLVKTSNPGSGWLQDQTIGNETVSTRIARLVDQVGENTRGASGLSNVGAVVGATYGPDAERLRQLMPSSILLTPGVGPQGGSLDEVRKLKMSDGTGILVPVSRGITQTNDLSMSRDAYAELIGHRICELADSLA